MHSAESAQRTRIRICVRTIVDVPVAVDPYLTAHGIAKQRLVATLDSFGWSVGSSAMYYATSGRASWQPSPHGEDLIHASADLSWHGAMESKEAGV